ncbi:MAG: DUF3606 domain-containing protein [Pyrinomonadaceae bacterium]|nr:DUF3606 domain-containing protein [Sphingobacteriaceae bacterium]
MKNLDNIVNFDQGRINFSLDNEVIYWAQKFKVSARQLYEAAREAGSSISQTEKALIKLGHLEQPLPKT